MDFHSNSRSNATIAVSERDKVGRLLFLRLLYASLALHPCTSSGHGERRRLRAWCGRARRREGKGGGPAPGMARPGAPPGGEGRKSAKPPGHEGVAGSREGVAGKPPRRECSLFGCFMQHSSMFWRVFRKFYRNNYRNIK